MTSRHVAVTGASGYIGRRVLAELDHAEIRVTPLTRAGTEGQFRCLRTGVVGTLEQHFEGVDNIIHLAGRLVDDPSAGILDYFDANVAFADAVLHAADRQGVTSAIHASTRLVYPSTLSDLADESSDTDPDTPYGVSKRWAEDLFQQWSKVTGNSALSLRIGQVTGGDHPGLGVINSFVRQARTSGVVTVLGEGSAVRDIVHVDDVASAFLAALEYRGSWSAVNIGGVRSVTIAELGAMVASAAPGPVTVTRRAVEHEDLSCYGLRTDRALRLIGWSASRTPEAIIAEAFAD